MVAGRYKPLSARKESKSQRTVKWIRFQWDDRTTEITDCDTKHFLYLIYRALLAVERRQREKNRYYLKMGCSERVLDPLDKEAVITGLLDGDRSRLNGPSFGSMSGRAFTNEVIAGCGGGRHCSIGWATKIYAKLEAEKCHRICGEVAIPNLKYQDLE